MRGSAPSPERSATSYANGTSVGAGSPGRLTQTVRMPSACAPRRSESIKSPTCRTSSGPSASAASARTNGAGSGWYAHVLACHDRVEEQGPPFDTPDETAELAESIMGRFADGEYPHLAELASGHIMKPGYDHGDEFEFGLNLILDGLQRAKPARRPAARSAANGDLPD